MTWSIWQRGGGHVAVVVEALLVADFDQSAQGAGEGSFAADVDDAAGAVGEEDAFEFGVGEPGEHR